MDDTIRTHLEAALDSLAEAAAAAGAPTDEDAVDLDALVESDDPLFQSIGQAAASIQSALDSAEEVDEDASDPEGADGE